MQLSAQNIIKNYDHRRVVNGISLHVTAGEAVSVLGPNGAGKTTCFSIIAGLIKPDSGKILLDNHDITDLPMYRRAMSGVAYLPQESSVFRGLTVAENIMAILEIVINDHDDRVKRLEELLGEFDISHIQDVVASALSGGERRRLEIARCLAIDPKFVLLDEPLAGIDPISVNDIKGLISHLKARNIGILITDHNVRETLNMVDRAYIVHDGRVITHGTANEIVQSEIAREKYLGDTFSL